MKTEDDNQPVLEIQTLPNISREEADFLDTSFFQSNGASSSHPRLPTPAEISRDPRHKNQKVAIFESLNLAVKVKHKSTIKLEEAQVMVAIRRAFPNGEVPVPEVFGWRQYDEKIYIYQSLAAGTSLGEAWPSLTEAEKVSICGELSRIVEALRRLRQGTPSSFIGSINGGRIQDRYFHFDKEAGPLPSVKAFNDLFLAAATRQKYDPERTTVGPHRETLPDTGNIYFTHGDLTPTNVMIAGPPRARKVEAIVDWEQAGWYPEYWEYCKMQYGISLEHGWNTEGWPDKVMKGKKYEDEFWTFWDYFSWRGCP